MNGLEYNIILTFNVLHYFREDGDPEVVSETTAMPFETSSTHPPSTTTAAASTISTTTTTFRTSTRRVRKRPTVARTTTTVTTAPIVRFKAFDQSDLLKNLKNVESPRTATSAVPLLVTRSTATPFVKFKPFLQSDFFTNMQKADDTTTATTASTVPAPPFVRFKPFSQSDLFSKFPSGSSDENNLDMVLKFMSKDQILGTVPGADARRKEEGGVGTRAPGPSQARPVSDLTLMSMGVPSDDDDAISAMMELTEFGLKSGAGGDEPRGNDDGGAQGKSERLRERGMSKPKNRGKKKNENLQTRRRPRPSRPLPTTISSTTEETGSPFERFPHYPSKTPYGSTTVLPTGNSTETPTLTTFELPKAGPDDVLTELELDLQAELDEIRKLQETIQNKEVAKEGKRFSAASAVEGIASNEGSFGGKRLSTQQVPTKTRRPMAVATSPPVTEESVEKDEMSHIELQKVASKRPELSTKPRLQEPDVPLRNNPFMRRKKLPRPMKTTTRQPTLRPPRPIVVNEFQASSSPPPATNYTSTEEGTSSNVSLFSSTSTPPSSPASSTPFTRFKPQRNPAHPSSTSFIRFEMMPHGPFFTSDLAEQSLASSVEEEEDDKLAQLNLEPQRPTLSTTSYPTLPTGSVFPRRPMHETPNIIRPSTAEESSIPDMSNMPKRPRPNMSNKPDITRPLTRPEMLDMPALSRPDMPSMHNFPMLEMPRPSMESPTQEEARPPLSRPGILNMPIPTQSRRPNPVAANRRPVMSVPRGKQDRPSISFMEMSRPTKGAPVPEEPSFFSSTTNRPHPTMFTVGKPTMPHSPESTMISEMENFKANGEKGKRPDIVMPDLLNIPALSSPDMPSMLNFPMLKMPKVPHTPMGSPMLEAARPALAKPGMLSMPISTQIRRPNIVANRRPAMSVPRPNPKRPSISFMEMSRPTKVASVSHTTNRPRPMHTHSIGKPSMHPPALPHRPGPAMTSEMENFMENVEDFTTQPLPKPNSTAINFKGILRPQSQPSLEFAMENLMSMFEPSRSPGGSLKTDAQRPPSSSFMSMNLKPSFDPDFLGNRVKSTEAPITSIGGDVGGGNFMTFRFGPVGGGGGEIDGGDEGIEFSTSLLDLLDQGPNEGGVTTSSTPHSNTFDHMPFIADEMGNDFMKLMFDENMSPERDASKRATPRPFDNPYMNYFENEEGEKSRNEEAFHDDATPFTFSRRPTPTPLPTVEAFTVRMKPTGAPISLPTTPRPTLKPFVVRPSSGPLGGPMLFHHMKKSKNKRPHSSSSFQRFDLPLGFAHRSTASPFHASLPTRPKRKLQPPPLAPAVTVTAKKPLPGTSSKLDALRVKLQGLSKTKTSKAPRRPQADIPKPFKASQLENRPSTFQNFKKPFKMSPTDFNGRLRPPPPLHSLRPLKPYTPPPIKAFTAQRPPPKTRPKNQPPPPLPPFPVVKKPIPASVARPGAMKPFTVRPKSTIVPHNFVQPANIKKMKKPSTNLRPPPTLKKSPPPFKPKRPPAPPAKPMRPHVPNSVGRPSSPKPLRSPKPLPPSSMSNELKAPEPSAADFKLTNVAGSFDGPLFYGDANIKNLTSPYRPSHKPRKERRPHDKPPPSSDSVLEHHEHEDDFDYLAALYDDYDHTLFPGQHDDRPPISTFAPGFDKFPKFEEEKVGEVPSSNSVAVEIEDASSKTLGHIESLLRDLPHTGGTPQEDEPEFARGTSLGGSDAVPSPATIVGSLPRPALRQQKPAKGGLKRPFFRPSSPVGMKAPQRPPGGWPSRNVPPRLPPLPVTRLTPHPKLKLPKMDQELLGFISTIPGYMQKMMSNIGDNFTGRDLKDAVVRIENLKSRHESQDAVGDDYEESEGVDAAVS